MLKSRFSFYNFYFPMGIGTIIFTLTAILLTWPEAIRHHHSRISHSSEPGGLLLLIPALIIDLLIFNIKRLTIRPEGLTVRTLFRKQTIAWEDIEGINLMTTDSTLFTTNSESTTIQLKTGKRIILPVPLYRKMRDLRIILSRVAALLKEGKDISSGLDFTIPPEIAVKEITSAKDEDLYSGSFAISFNGIIFYGFMLFLLIMIVNSKPSAAVTALIVAFSFMGFFYLIFGIQTYYFIIRDKQLVIKSQLFFWYRQVYDLDEIKDVKIEYISKRGINLRVTKKDFQSKAFAGGSLRNSTWRSLAERFQQLEIPVRNQARV